MSDSASQHQAADGPSVLQRTLVALLVLLTSFAMFRAWQLGQSVPGIDYYQFWVVGEAIEHDGVTNPYLDSERARMGGVYLERAAHLDSASRQYAAAQGRAVLETYSTPFLYMAMHAIASGDYERDFTRWHLLSLIAFGAGVVGFAQLVGIGWGGSLGVLALMLVWGAPFQSETQVANVNRVQLGTLALAAAMASRSRSLAGNVALGGVLATMAMFKPNVAFAVLLLVVAVSIHRERNTLLACLAGVAAGALLCMVASALFYGSAAAWFDWASTLAVIPEEIIRVSLGNYAALPLLMGGASASASVLLAVALCVPVVVGLVRHPRTNDDDFAQLVVTTLGLGCVVALLSATLVWEHYFLLALPLAIATAATGVSTRLDGPLAWLRFRVLPAVALLALLATPTYGIAGLPHETYFPLVQGSALVILYGLGIAMLLNPAGSES